MGGKWVNIMLKFDCLDDYPDTRRRIQTHLLPIRYGSGHNSSVGLLLEPTNNENGQYRRLGRYYVIKSFERFAEACRLASFETGSSDFAEILVGGNGEAQYFIDIV